MGVGKPPASGGPSAWAKKAPAPPSRGAVLPLVSTYGLRSIVLALSGCRRRRSSRASLATISWPLPNAASQASLEGNQSLVCAGHNLRTSLKASTARLAKLRPRGNRAVHPHERACPVRQTAAGPSSRCRWGPITRDTSRLVMGMSMAMNRACVRCGSHDHEVRCTATRSPTKAGSVSCRAADWNSGRLGKHGDAIVPCVARSPIHLVHPYEGRVLD